MLGYILGVISLGAFAYFAFAEDGESALSLVSSIVVGYTIVYPFVVAQGLANIKRLAQAASESHCDDEHPVALSNPDRPRRPPVDRHHLAWISANFILVIALLLLGAQARRWNDLAGLLIGVVVGLYAWRSIVALLRRRA